MTSTFIARLIGASFGLVFFIVNAGGLPTPAAWLVRALGVVLFVAVLARMRALGEQRITPRPEAIRVYWISVILEVLALFAGTRLLSSTGHATYGVCWVAVVVGVHFLPFAWAFRQPRFGQLGIALIALGVIGAAAGLLGAGETAIAVISGVGSGLALLAYAAAPPIGTASAPVQN